MNSDAFTRWLYRGHRPHGIARFTNRLEAGVAARGIGASAGLVTLEVTGRTSGRTISLPLVMVAIGGERYFVSMLGEHVQWVKNIRASGGRAVLRSGGTEPVCLEEVPTNQRALILKAYLRRAPGARPHIPVDKDAPLADFERIAGDYPVFHVTPALAREDAHQLDHELVSAEAPVLSAGTGECPTRRFNETGQALLSAAAAQPRSRFDGVLFALSAAGIPIGVVMLRHFGRLGALLLEVAASGLGIRAATMVVTGTPRRLRPLPRLLLYAETAVDALAMGAGFWAWVWRPFVRTQRQEPTPTRSPVAGTSITGVTAVATSAWMMALALHTARMAIYISPGRGLRAADQAPSTNGSQV